MLKLFTKILQGSVVTLLILVGLVLLLSVFPIANYKFFVIESGSMQPTIATGSMVLVQPQNSYQVGDVITFINTKRGKTPITHRIYEAREQGTYITKGDANDLPDLDPINPSRVIGKVVFAVPYIGQVTNAAKTPIGFTLLVTIPAVIMIIDQTRRIIFEARKLRRKDVKIIKEPKRIYIDGILPIRRRLALPPKKQPNFLAPAIAICLLLVTALLFVPFAFSSYSDSVDIANNSITTAAFAPNPLQIDAVSENDNPIKVKVGKQSLRQIKLFKTGELDFQYKVLTDITYDPDGLCASLIMKARLFKNSKTEYMIKEAQLLGFETEPIEFSDPKDRWHFRFTLPNDASEELFFKTCTFDIVYSAWSGEFTAEDRVSYTVQSRKWQLPDGEPLTEEEAWFDEPQEEADGNEEEVEEVIISPELINPPEVPAETHVDVPEISLTNEILESAEPEVISESTVSSDEQ